MKTTGLLKLALKVFKADNNKVVDDGDSKANRTVMNLSKNKKSKKLTYVPNIGSIGEPNFLTPNAKKAFKYSQLAFIKALILQYFDLENYIRIKTNVLGYAIGEVSSQLNLNSNAPLNNSNKSDFSK